MAKKDEAARLLRAMSNVDDKYIEEAINACEAAPRKAVVTSLKKYSGIIGGIAAAAVLLLIGGSLLGLFSSTGAKPMSDAEEVSSHNASFSAQYSSDQAVMELDTAVAPTEANDEVRSPDAAPTGAVDGSYLSGGEESMDFVSIVEASSLDELNELTGMNFVVPEEINGYAAGRFCIIGDVRVVVDYFDENNNIVCMITKVVGDEIDSSSTTCYAVTHKVDIEGSYENVSILGNGTEYALALWTCDGYAYEVSFSDMVSEEYILAVVSQVS